MDKYQATTAIVTQLNKLRIGEIKDFEFIVQACNYFDFIKNQSLSPNDLSFLKFISNISGIPHYFDLLEKFEIDTQINNFDLNTLGAVIYESTLNTTLSSKLHKYQNQILSRFQSNKRNRYFLSATTSFGKTHLIYEIIRYKQYNNILLLFPTIALLSENLEKIQSDKNYKYLKDNYKIHTMSESTTTSEKNIFVFTPERYLSFLDKSRKNLHMDFVFIDEIYKIDNEYIIDQETKENERDTAYRVASYFALEKDNDILLAGPFIDLPENSEPRSLLNFFRDNDIIPLNYNNFEIVTKSYIDIKAKSKVKLDEKIEFVFTSTQKTDRLIKIVSDLFNHNENIIIYCYSRSSVESYSKKILETGFSTDHIYDDYLDFVNHLSREFSEDWIVTKALKKGIGIHHGLIPKYIQKEIINLFNEGKMSILLSTTTITEGVNTSAKNIVVLHDKKGDKELRSFDAKNIAGRAGRFLFHYHGRVIVLQNNFMKILNSDTEELKHKNYDNTSIKDDIDIFFTKTEYLSEGDTIRKDIIEQESSDRNLDEFLFNQFRTISRSDKILIYDYILKLEESKLNTINSMINKLNYKIDIDYDGFQNIIEVILPIVKNSKLKNLIINKKENDKYSILTHLVHFYLIDGFKGSIRYKQAQGSTIDQAISETADFIYHTLKYQVVKYVGVFNLIYKYIDSKKKSVSFDEALGIDRLLLKLEYNALTEEGRIASDYGVPAKILDYYENPDMKDQISSDFDSYENEIFKKINELLNDL